MNILNLIETHNITELIVLNPEQKPLKYVPWEVKPLHKDQYQLECFR